MFILFSLILGLMIIIIAFIFNEDNYFNINGYIIINTSYLLLLQSLGISLVFSSIWSMLQYYPLNGYMNCIKHTSGTNIFCIILGMFLLILSIIGFFNEFVDSYNNYNTIQYPLWLILLLFVISITCFVFVWCINTKSAKLEKKKRLYLQNYYFDKVIKMIFFKIKTNYLHIFRNMVLCILMIAQ